MFTTWLSWNTANVGVKHQSINQSLCLYISGHCVLLKIQNNNPCLFIYNTPGKQCSTLYGFTCNKKNNQQYHTVRTIITSNITIPHRQNNYNVKHQYHTVRTIIMSNITIPHRQNNYNVKQHNTTPSEQL